MWTTIDDHAELFDKVSVTGPFGKAIILCHYTGVLISH